MPSPASAFHASNPAPPFFFIVKPRSLLLVFGEGTPPLSKNRCLLLSSHHGSMPPPLEDQRAAPSSRRLRVRFLARPRAWSSTNRAVLQRRSARAAVGFVHPAKSMPFARLLILSQNGSIPPFKTSPSSPPIQAKSPRRWATSAAALESSEVEATVGAASEIPGHRPGSTPLRLPGVRRSRAVNPLLFRAISVDVKPSSFPV